MTIRIFTSEANWMESSALKQLESIAAYPGARLVAGLPDLHACRTPVGLDRQNAAAGRQLHDQLERGNPFAVFAGLEFAVMGGEAGPA